MSSDLKYPPFGLTLFDGQLLLKVVEDSDLVHMCSVTVEDIFEPNCPWEFPWLTNGSNTAQFHWGLRAGNNPAAWTLSFAAYLDGEYVGTIDMRATQFSSRRSIETGSYVLRKFQGQGIGKRMRAMVAAFAFDYLGARELRTGWHPRNAASAGVSHSLGYEVVGRTEFGEDDRPEIHARLVPENFAGHPIQVSGHTSQLREFLGL